MKKIWPLACLLMFLFSVQGVAAIGEGVERSQVVNQIRLETVLANQEINGPLAVNFLKLGVREAVAGGVPVNTVVLLLLFPLVAVLVAFSRNVVGINGFGILTPAVVAMAFLSTGPWVGLILFGVILLTATVARMLIRRVKVPYLPRMAFLIWLVSLSVLGLLVGAAKVRVANLNELGIFPILLFVLLAETFIDAQITRTVKAALVMTAETLVLALVAFFIIGSVWVQSLVLLHPEIVVLAILVVDLMIGRYSGLRLLEIWRFRELLKT